jgi:Cft2 family RNA processing exonuclease
MEVRFLGGAGGVGASCVYVELAGRQLLVDAGVRMGGRDRLPDLAALDGRDLAAIFVTHAHADHIGALPLVHEHFPHVPIYATPATIRLIEVMLADAVRVMSRRAAEELEIPLYDDALVASMLRSLRPLQPEEQSVARLPGVVVHARRAGHVAGAVSLGFDAPDGRLVISGDVSMTAQRSVLGALVPAPKRPHLLVLESTYGARLHPNRHQEEQRLAQSVAEWVRSGHVLIPAFALGRAQEVILILRSAQRDGLIPEFQIYVDGLVRTICAAYAGFPNALTPALRNHLLRGGRPFLGGSVRAVENPAERERILEGPPCCIIASSGMLTGGPSAFYAARLVERADAAIVVTGYQDEEAPGRKLLDLAEQGAGGEISIAGRTAPVRCRVATYALSAHADGGELAGMVRALQPRAVALVHGDPEARAALGAKLAGLAEVILPHDGMALPIAAAARGGLRVAAPANPHGSSLPVGVGQGAPLDTAGVERLWQALNDGSGVQTFGVRELARVWYGDAAGPQDEAQTQAALEGEQISFAPVAGVAGLWRLRAAVEVRRDAAAGRRGTAGPARPDQMAIQAIIDRRLGDAPDLYRRSVDATSGAVTLGFFFPDVAGARYAEAIAALAEEAGVPVALASEPHQQALAEAALAALPDGLSAMRAPSIKFALRTVQVRCDGAAEPMALRDAEQVFHERTGWRLEIVSAAPPARPAETAVVQPGAMESAQQSIALDIARELFPSYLGCYKISLDAPATTLTLRFYFPDVAVVSHQDRLEQLAASTGWTVRVHPQTHQEELIRAVTQVLPAGVELDGRPSLDQERRVVSARCRRALTPEQVEAAQASFAERTGWALALAVGS